MTDTHVKIRIEGISPLLVHAIPQSLLFPDPGGKQVYTGAKPTPREEADASLYKATVKGKDIPVIPGQNLFKCLIEGGKFHKIGRSKVTTRDSSLVPAAITLLDMVIPIEFEAPWEVHSQMITNQNTGGKVPCHRPRFDDWALEFELQVDADFMNINLIRLIVDDAGKKIGLGSRRPERKGPFGKFVVTQWKVSKNGKK